MLPDCLALVFMTVSKRDRVKRLNVIINIIWVGAFICSVTQDHYFYTSFNLLLVISMTTEKIILK
jgi:hypothetical protein